MMNCNKAPLMVTNYYTLVQVKCHNACKRHNSNDTGFKQTERDIFLHVIQWDKNWNCF